MLKIAPFFEISINFCLLLQRHLRVFFTFGVSSFCSRCTMNSSLRKTQKVRNKKRIRPYVPTHSDTVHQMGYILTHVGPSLLFILFKSSSFSSSFLSLSLSLSYHSMPHFLWGKTVIEKCLLYDRKPFFAI